jgi:tetratricopeptide (TPR) repeat protein
MIENRRYMVMFVRTLMFSALALLAATGLTVSGCGGGGGGSVTGETNGTNTNTNTTSSTVASSLTELNAGNYSNAVTSFQNYLTANPTASDAATAYEGLGWAYLKLGEISSAISSLEHVAGANSSAAANVDLDIALSSCYLARGGYSNAKSALGYLETAGFADTTKTYAESTITTGLTTGEIRAFMSFLYYMRNTSGDDATAATMKNSASIAGASRGNAGLILDALSALGL